MTTPFSKYFRDEVEYPRDIAANPLPIGTRYDYVSNTFLNGFINYVSVVKGFVLARYCGWTEQDWIDAQNQDHECQIRNPETRCMEWIKVEPKSKDELFNLVTAKNAISSPKMDCDFQDDVMILAKITTDEDKTLWYFFWFDRDCSDCSIGRFLTNDTDEEVIASFTEYVMNHHANDPRFGAPREIPLHYFNSGWISS